MNSRIQRLLPENLQELLSVLEVLRNVYHVSLPLLVRLEHEGLLLLAIVGQISSAGRDSLGSPGHGPAVLAVDPVRPVQVGHGPGQRGLSLVGQAAAHHQDTLAPDEMNIN